MLTIFLGSDLSSLEVAFLFDAGEEFGDGGGSFLSKLLFVVELMTSGEYCVFHEYRMWLLYLW